MFAELGIYGASRAKSIPQYKPFIAMSCFTIDIFQPAWFRIAIFQLRWPLILIWTVFFFTEHFSLLFLILLFPQPTLFSRSSEFVADNDDVMCKKTSYRRQCSSPGNMSALWWELGMVALIGFFFPPSCSAQRLARMSGMFLLHLLFFTPRQSQVRVYPVPWTSTTLSFELVGGNSVL